MACDLYSVRFTLCVFDHNKKNGKQIYDLNLIIKMHQTQIAGYSTEQLFSCKGHTHERQIV